MRELIDCRGHKRSSLPNTDSQEYRLWNAKVHTIAVLKNVLDLSPEAVRGLMVANVSVTRALARENGIY